MTNHNTAERKDLADIVDQKVTALVLELENADWSAGEVALAIDDVIQSRWLKQMALQRAARDTVEKSFVSDGNEG